MARTPAFPATPAALADAIADALPAIPDAVKHYRALARRLPAARALIEDFARFLPTLEKIAGALRALAEPPGPAVLSTDPLYLVTVDGRLVDWPLVTYDAAAVVELGADLSVPAGDDRRKILESGGPYVPWWPAVPAELAAVGVTVADCPANMLRDVDLVGLAATLPLLRGRARGFDDFAKRLSLGPKPISKPLGAARRTVRAAEKRYTAWIRCFEPLPALEAARIAAYLELTSSAIAALVTELADGDLTVPTLTTPAVVTSLATRIRDQITAGHGGRLQVSDSEVAFAWSPAAATTLLSYLATHTVDGRHTTVVRVKDGPVKAGPVAEGAAKPTGVVVFESDDVDLVKYAGMAVLPVESAQFVSNIEPAISAVMVGQIVRAIEADTVAEITANAGVVIAAAADITAGVLAAIAGIRGNGGTPTVVGLNSDDWIALMTETGAGGGYVNFSNPEAGPAGTWLGLAPVLVPGLAAGSAIVADGSAVSVLEPAGGPLCVVDMYTELSNNKVRVVIEEWATSQVTSPGGVATVGVTVTP